MVSSCRKCQGCLLKSSLKTVLGLVWVYAVIRGVVHNTKPFHALHRPISRSSAFPWLNQQLRHLVFDFADLNASFDANRWQGVIRRVNCSEIGVDDIEIAHEMLHRQEMIVTANMSLFSFKCNVWLSVTYRTPLGRIAMSATLLGGSNNSRISVPFHVASHDFASRAPTRIHVVEDSCTSRLDLAIELQNAEAWGVHLNFRLSVPIGLVTSVYSLFSAPLQNLLTRLICNYLRHVTETVVTPMMSQSSARLRKYASTPFEPINRSCIDSRVTERARKDNISLINLATAKGRLLPLFMFLQDRGIIKRLTDIEKLPLPFMTKRILYENDYVRLRLCNVSLFGDHLLAMFNESLIKSQLTIGKSLHVKKFEVLAKVEMEIIAPGDSLCVAGLQNSSETYDVVLELDHLAVEFLLMLALNEKLLQTEFGSLLANPSDCLLNLTFDAKVSVLASVGGIAPILVSKVGGDEVRHVFSQLMFAVNDAYNGSLRVALPGFVTDVVSIANDAFGTMLQLHHQCPDFKGTGLQFVPLMGDNPIARISAELNSQLHPASNINQKLDGWQAPGGALDLRNKSFVFTREAGEFGRLSVEVNDVRISNIDSLSDLNLLYPTNNFTALTSMGLGNHFRQFRFEATVSINLTGGPANYNVYDKFNITIGIDSFLLQLKQLLKIDYGKIARGDIEEFLNPWCWIASLNDTSLVLFNITFRYLNISMRCGPASCSSPGLWVLGERAQSSTVIRNFTAKMNEYLSAVTTPFTTEHGHEQLRKLIARHRSHCEGLAMPTVEEVLGTQSLKREDKVWQSFLCVLGVSSLIIIYAVMRCCYGVGPFENVEGKTSPGGTELRRSFVRYVDATVSNPLAWHVRVPYWIRLIVPLLSILSLCLFVYGHFFAAAGCVVSRIGLAGESFKVPFQGDSIVGSEVMLWRQGAYPLALLIGVFSIVWPYTKIVVLGLCWFLSPEQIESYGMEREHILQTLNLFNKWALMYVYVSVLNMVFFQVHVENKGNALFGNKFYTVDAFIQPGGGLFAFLAGMIMSLLVSSIAVACQRRVAQPSKAYDDGKTQSFSDMFITVLDGDVEKRIPVVRKGSVMKWALMLAMSSVVLGALLPAIQVELGGFFHALMELGNPGSTVVSYSFIGAALHLMSPGQDLSAPLGMAFVVFFYIFFGLVIPLLRFLLLIILWSRPATLATQERILFAAEIANAWSVLDVYLVAITVSLFEFDAVSSISDYMCSGVQVFLNIAVEYELLDAPSCMDVFPTYRIGAFILLIGAFMGTFLHGIVISISIIAVEQRKKGEQPVIRTSSRGWFGGRFAAWIRWRTQLQEMQDVIENSVGTLNSALLANCRDETML